MISNIGVPGVILILVLVLLFFGPSRLPQIGQAMGETLKELKLTAKELTSDKQK